MVERLAGRENTHVKDWPEKKGDILAADLPGPKLFKLYELCMWKVLDKELRPRCLDGVSFLVEGLRKAEEWGDNLFVTSMDVASAFHTIKPEILGDAASGVGRLRLLNGRRGKREPEPANARRSTWKWARDKEAPGRLQAGTNLWPPWSMSWCGYGPIEIEQWNGLLGGKISTFLVWADNIFTVTNKLRSEAASVSSSTRAAWKSYQVERRRKTKSPSCWMTKKIFGWVPILLVLGCFFDSTGFTAAQIKGRLFQG